MSSRRPRPVSKLAVAHSPTPSKRQNRGPVERGRIERAGGVREVMLGEDDLLLVGVPEAAAEGRARTASRASRPVRRSRTSERRAGRRRDRPWIKDLNLRSGLVVKAYIVDVGDRQARLAQAVVRWPGRETDACRVSSGRSALLLEAAATTSPSSSAACGVVIERRDSEDGSHIGIGPTPAPCLRRPLAPNEFFRSYSPTAQYFANISSSDDIAWCFSGDGIAPTNRPRSGLT